MPIRTQDSLSGFIASEPKLTTTERGDARLWVKVGQEHYRREPDGTFTELEPTFCDLVAYKKTAERAARLLAKGDRFVAEGYIHHYDTPDADGQQVQAEEFVAKRLGHDLARTPYQVARRRESPAVGQASTRAFASPSETTTRRSAHAGLGM